MVLALLTVKLPSSYTPFFLENSSRCTSQENEGRQALCWIADNIRKDILFRIKSVDKSLNRREKQGAEVKGHGTNL